MTCGQLQEPQEPPVEPATVANDDKVDTARPPRPSKGLSKTATNFLVDLGCFIFLLVAILAASIVQFVFPSGTTAAGWTLWGLGYDTWCIIQFASLAAFVLMVVIHLILHWTWICAFIVTRVGGRSGRDARMSDGVKTLYGVTLLTCVLTLLGILLAAAYFAVEAP